MIRIKLLCNWCSSNQLRELWNKMSKGNYRWNNIYIMDDDEIDYYIIINYTNDYYDPKKTIIFQMEPTIPLHHPEVFKVFKHSTHYNNIEWHLSLNYNQLMTIHINKKYNMLSTILSNKYYDEGHIKRINFIKYIDDKLDIHVYGCNLGYRNYKGSLPYHQKDNSILPYKYVFNAENNSIPNYFTEKIIDAILGESLCFYYGCPNVSDYIDSRAYIQLNLNDFESDKHIIQYCINNNEWEKRIDIIRNEKFRILNELQFFPRLEKILNNINY